MLVEKGLRKSKDFPWDSRDYKNKIHLIKREEAETMEIGKKWVKLALLAKKEMEAWRGRRIVKKVITVIYGDYDKG